MPGCLRGSPLLEQEGVAAPSRTLERRGRGGQSRPTTPSALSKDASRYFLMRSTPPIPGGDYFGSERANREEGKAKT
jgi:hypothetical protein